MEAEVGVSWLCKALAFHDDILLAKLSVQSSVHYMYRPYIHDLPILCYCKYYRQYLLYKTYKTLQMDGVAIYPAGIYVLHLLD